MTTLLHDINILLLLEEERYGKMYAEKILIDTALTACNYLLLYFYMGRTLQITPWLNHKEYRILCSTKKLFSMLSSTMFTYREL